jgi:hypothetical protein
LQAAIEKRNCDCHSFLIPIEGTPMKPFIPFVVAIICFCFVSVQESQAQLLQKDRAVAAGLNWSEACALESVAAYADCRRQGGGYFACAAVAGWHYWNCSGSNFQTSFRPANRMRAVMAGNRVLRRSR